MHPRDMREVRVSDPNSTWLHKAAKEGAALAQTALPGHEKLLGWLLPYTGP